MGLCAVARTSRIPSDRFTVTFSQAFVRAVLVVLEKAYRRLAQRCLKDHDEVATTGVLVEELRTVIKRRTFPPGGFLLAVHDDPPVDIRSGTGKRRPRIDLQIEQIQPGPRPMFSFEAKRLGEENLKSATEYIGNKGLGCFVSGKYAADSDRAGMLAYIESGIVEDWIQKLRIRIPKRKVLGTLPNGFWSVPSYAPKQLTCRRSHHARVRSSAIEIVHLFFDLVRAFHNCGKA